MGAKDNKFLKVNPSVKLTPVIEPVIIALDGWYEKEGLTGVVTSGFRSEDDQLNLIRKFLKEYGLNIKYSDAMVGGISEMFVWEGQSVYKWQPGWSALLNKGIIVNPPIRAICLMNYINSAGVNRRGQIIEGSNHTPGNAFDMGGGSNGLNDEIALIIKAKSSIPGIVDWVIERRQNCLHVNCKKV